MTRSDLIINLVKAGSSGDVGLLRQTVEAMVADERAKQHHVLADKLLANLRQPSEFHFKHPEADESVRALFLELRPARQIEDLILAADAMQVCNELVEEHHRKDLLRTFNLEPRHKILLAGPPGNGKTSLAEAIAESLFLPLIVVQYDSLVGSYLGETAQRLRKLFDYVRNQSCVLFFDEFESISKERNDPHESGEIKRIVSSLLMQIDRLPSNVLVVAATNHPEMLDYAVWRRFQIQLVLQPPTQEQIKTWLRAFENRLGVKLGNLSNISEKLEGLSFAEIEQFTMDVHRRFILNLPDADLRSLLQIKLRSLPNRMSS